VLTKENYFKRFGFVKFKIVCLGPVIYVRELGMGSVRHVSWDKEVGVICELHKFVISVQRSQIRSSDCERRWTDSGALHNAGLMEANDDDVLPNLVQ